MEDISSLKADLVAQRERLTLYQRPFSTLFLFGQVCVDNLIYFIKSLVTSKVLYLLLLPSIIGYTVLKTNGLFQEETDFVDFLLKYISWWVGLGVLSSIGLGSGMHSGILFLFPHIFNVVTASKKCPSMAFESFCDMWNQDCDMHCQDSSSKHHSEGVEFMEVLIRVLPAAILWGSGTAMGEIPPYLVSRAAAISGEKDEETEEMLKEAEGDGPFAKMKKWMIDFVERHGFFGVLAMSAWPNAAFDLVGICCGQLGVSFWTFFGATLIGKGLIKVTGQALFFVTWFRNPEVVIRFFQRLGDNLKSAIPIIPIDGKMIKEKLESALEQVSKGKMKEEDEQEGWVKYLGEKVILAVMAVFLLTTVQQLAQARQKTYDDKQLQKLQKSK